MYTFDYYVIWVYSLRSMTCLFYGNYTNQSKTNNNVNLLMIFERSYIETFSDIIKKDECQHIYYQIISVFYGIQSIR